MSEPFEIRRTLIVSGAHMNNSDIELLKNKHLAFEEYGYGYRILYSKVNSYSIEHLTKLGYSEGFTKSLLLSRVLDCDRIEFDCDGPVIEEIPEYEDTLNAYPIKNFLPQQID